MRKQPMTLAQVKRFHRWHFAVAVMAFTWLAVVALLCEFGLYYTQAPTITDYAVTLAVAGWAVYFWRVMHRRWHRLGERNG